MGEDTHLPGIVPTEHVLLAVFIDEYTILHPDVAGGFCDATALLSHTGPYHAVGPVSGHAMGTDLAASGAISVNEIILSRYGSAPVPSQASAMISGSLVKDPKVVPESQTTEWQTLGKHGHNNVNRACKSGGVHHCCMHSATQKSILYQPTPALALF